MILDEFQRFKHLLNPGAVANEDEREAAELANQLFNWSRDDEQCRVLLLSATPYKAYTLAQEEAEDNHYEDFLRTVEFLDPDVPRHQSFCTNLSSYGQLMYDLSETGWETIAARKADIESHLNRVMSRTERIPATQKHDAMLGEHSLTELHLLPDELVGYTGLSHISEELGQRDIVDYWASAPYPLNFMEDYQIKQLLKSHLADCTATSTIATLLRKAQPHFLNFARIEAYQAVSFANSRLRALAMQLSQSRAWELLWVPPSLPRYQLIGPFREAANRGFTKQLIFSAWQVVPKSIATLLSFEAERRAFVGDNSTEQSLIGARERQTPLLRIAADEGRLAGMPVLGLIYPSRTLCDIG
ncbi:MAG: DEAD/DEAH box helicase, partial [bacterium]